MKARTSGYVEVVAMTVGAAMAPRPPTVLTTDTVHEAARRMHDLALDSLPVCDGDGMLLGVVTERDIVRRSTAAGHDPTRRMVSELLTGPVLCVEVGDSPEAALGCMIEHAVRRLPVVERGRLIGTVGQAALADLLPASVVRRLIASTALGRAERG